MPSLKEKKEKRSKGFKHLKAVAVIASAGMGLRLGGRKKNYLEIAGRPVLAHTLSAFEKSPLVGGVVVVVPASDIDYCETRIVKRFGFKKVLKVIPGGKERQDSVACALDVLGSEWEVVVVHDGARPLVTPEIIDKTIRAAYRSGAAVTAVELKDTVKEVTGGKVKRTIPRDRLRAVQTPQGFRLDLLKEAYKRAAEQGLMATDDSSLVEGLGEKVKVIEGSYENIKITTEEDVELAEVFLRRRRSFDANLCYGVKKGGRAG
jgi:2-C-methyl-D-erythritol 4-phosphate cytidylyltransferase